MVDKTEDIVRLSDRGGITIPKWIRDHLDVDSNDFIGLRVNENGLVIMYKPNFVDANKNTIPDDAGGE